MVTRDAGNGAVRNKNISVVVAPDKFRGSLSASEAAAAMAAGVRTVLPDASIVLFPLSDGGEGMIDAIVATGAAEHVASVAGPLGATVTARWAFRGETAYIEAAQACGLTDRSPAVEGRALKASSWGLGQLLRRVVESMSPTRIVVGLGGTATSDGGFGMAAALGFAMRDSSQRLIDPRDHDAMDRVYSVTAPAAHAWGEVEVIAATDVDNPLLGAHGAATVFGPQKGATLRELDVLEARLVRWAAAVERSSGSVVSYLPGGGAAGGIAAGMVGLLGAQIASGSQMMVNLLSLAPAVHAADLVVTGEGSLDAQTLNGKAPAAVAALAREGRASLIAVAGRAELTNPAVVAMFGSIGIVSDEARPDEDSFRDAGIIAERLASRLTAEWMRERRS